MKNILLVEPSYKTKYPPLPLMKMSSYHKSLGDKVKFVKGNDDTLSFKDFDLVYITSLFTYEAKPVHQSVNFYKSMCINADIRVCGVYASLMPEHLKKHTGIDPCIGLWMDVEHYPPDYKLFPFHQWANHSFVFTSRGCPNKCKYCAVKELEPKRFVNTRWREHISDELPNVMVHDNNLTACDFNHYQDVMLHLAAIQKPVTFDNGFDCRIFSKKHCDLLSKVNIKTIRFAFDTMQQDGHIQKAIEICLKGGIPASKILVYILFNYRDDLEGALYRAREVVKLGARPYAMQYTPLDNTESFSYYYGNWDKVL